MSDTSRSSVSVIGSFFVITFSHLRIQASLARGGGTSCFQATSCPQVAKGGMDLSFPEAWAE